VLPVSATWESIVFGVTVLLSFVLAGHGVAAARADGLVAILGGSTLTSPGPKRQARAGRSNRWKNPVWRGSVFGVVLGLVGFRLAGVGGFLAGAGSGMAAPFILGARRQRRRADELERSIAEVAEATALGIRSGLSIPQALRFAADELGDPMRGALDEVLRATRLGTPLDRAITTWSEEVNRKEGTLLALILGIHGRSGGDLGGALEEVSRTVRHSISVQRELRAMSAQGRISGAILGSLPIGFFVVLAATSRSELDPVYHSGAGVMMIGVGLVLEALAYLWIRRLLRVDP
jgi:tight adherence protein B